MTSSRRSCSKSTSISGGSWRSTDKKRSNRSPAPFRADSRNAKAIADERVGGRAAALAENSFRFCETDDVVDGQKISGAIQLFDHRQFLGQGVFTNDRGTPAGYRRWAPSFVRATSASRAVVVALAEFAGIAMRLEVIQREPAALEEARRLADGFGRCAKQPRHLLGGFQMPLGIGFQKAARLLQRPMLADAGDDILQRPAFRRVIQHVVHGDQRDKRAVGNVPQLRQPAAIVAAIKQTGCEPDRAAAMFP